MPRYWNCPIYDGIEPEQLDGPHDTPEQALIAARALRKAQSDGDCLFLLEISDEGVPTLDAYTGADLEDHKLRTVYCNDCGHESDEDDFTPTDGRENEWGCPECGGSLNCVVLED